MINLTEGYVGLANSPTVSLAPKIPTSLWVAATTQRPIPIFPRDSDGPGATVGGAIVITAWFKAGLHVELGEARLTLPGWMMAP